MVNILAQHSLPYYSRFSSLGKFALSPKYLCTGMAKIVGIFP